LKQETTY